MNAVVNYWNRKDAIDLLCLWTIQYRLIFYSVQNKTLQQVCVFEITELESVSLALAGSGTSEEKLHLRYI